jgi:dolichol-phosphate mannosyltransferase
MPKAAARIKPASCTIVIPTYNERENIQALVTRISADARFRILVVDDSSPDGTGQVVAELSSRYPQVTLLSRPGKQGLGTAYVAGFKRALADGAAFIFEMDADFSHDPRYLPTLLAAAETRCDVAVGSRYVRGGSTIDWGMIRQFISRGGNLYARMILGLTLQDCTSGFRCYRRNVLEAIDLDRIRSNGYSFQIEMLYQAMCCGFQIGEVPIIFPDRRVGASKMSRGIVLEALMTVWRLRFSGSYRSSAAATPPGNSTATHEPINAADSHRAATYIGRRR